MGAPIANTFILASTIISVIAALAIHLSKWLRNYRMASTLPGPPAIPFVGNVIDIMRKRNDITDNFWSLSKEYPILCRLWIGPQLLVLVNDPELVKEMMLSHKMVMKPDYINNFLSELAPNGLVIAKPATWRVNRKPIASAFTSTFLQAYIEVFTAQSKILVQQLESHVGGAEFDAQCYFSRCTMDMICETAMGIQINAQTRHDVPFINALSRALQISSDRAFKFWLHPNMIFNLTRSGTEFGQCVKICRDFAEGVVREKQKIFRQERHQSKESQDTQDTEISSTRKTLLNVMLERAEDNEGISYGDLIDEVNAMIIAGLDTTSTAIGFVMLMLAARPDIQDKVYEEISQIYGKGDNNDERRLTLDELNEMSYLERVIKETLRLLPIVGFSPREATTDMTLGSFTIPRGSYVVAAIMAVHRNENIWPDPLNFDPDRFLPEEVQKRHPYSYLPFGAGARNCLGMRYAMVALKVLCATILRRYVVAKDHPTPLNELKMEFSVTLKLANNSDIKIRNRE